MEERRAQVIEDRLAKIEELKRRGIEPYAYRYAVTHHTSVAREGFERSEREGSLTEDGQGETVRLGGRLLSMRSHGKTVFADLGDRDGRLQLYFRKNDLGEAAFSILELLDTGDWIGVEGVLFRTRAGEVTVKVASFELLAKAVRPLPFGKEEVVDGAVVRPGHLCVGGAGRIRARHVSGHGPGPCQHGLPDAARGACARSRGYRFLRCSRPSRYDRPCAERAAGGLEGHPLDAEEALAGHLEDEDMSALTPGTVAAGESILKQLTPYFGRFSSVELHGCRVALGREVEVSWTSTEKATGRSGTVSAIH